MKTCCKLDIVLSMIYKCLIAMNVIFKYYKIVRILRPTKSTTECVFGGEYLSIK